MRRVGASMGHDELADIIGPGAAALASRWMQVFVAGWLVGLCGIALSAWAFGSGPTWSRVIAEALASFGVCAIVAAGFLMRKCAAQAREFVSAKLGHEVKLGVYRSVAQWCRAIRRERYFHEHGRPKRKIYQDWSEINRLCDEEDAAWRESVPD